MTQWMYYLSRSTGIVALLLVVAALLWGFLFSSRATGKRLRPNWWLDLHNWLGGLALTFTGLHLVTVWLNSDSGIGLVQIFLPQTASFNAWAITWGVIATYVMAAAVFTTWPRRWKNRRWWRVVHVSTVVATGLVFLHAYQAGSDASQRWFQAMLVLAAGVATYGLGLRLSTLRRADGDSQRAHSSVSPESEGGLA